MKARTSLFFVAVLGLLALCGTALGWWTEPVPVSEVNTEYTEKLPFLSYDGLTLYFARMGTDSFYYTRIYKATREEPYGPFTSVEEISELNYSGGHVNSPWVSPDNLRMYYVRTEPGSKWRLKVSERTSVDELWPQGVNISELNVLGHVTRPRLTADELTIVFQSKDIPGGQGSNDIYIATRPDIDSTFDNVRNLTEVNSEFSDSDGFLSPDGLTLYFCSNRNGPSQLFRATRESLDEAFGNIEHLEFFDTPLGTGSPAISADGTVLYFVTRNPENEKSDIWVSYCIEDPYELAIIRIEDAIAEKLEEIENIEATMENELAAVDALDELLESGELSDSEQKDVEKARKKILSTLKEKEKCIKKLEKDIKELQDALVLLGCEMEPQS